MDNQPKTASLCTEGGNKRSVGSFCCVPGCSNSRGQCNIKGIKLYFYPFPRDEKQKQLWLDRIGRNDSDMDGNTVPFQPKAHSRVCSSHFVGGSRSSNPFSKAYVPSIFPTACTKKGRMKKCTKKSLMKNCTKKGQMKKSDASDVRRPTKQKSVKKKVKTKPEISESPKICLSTSCLESIQPTDHDYIKSKSVPPTYHEKVSMSAMTWLSHYMRHDSEASMAARDIYNTFNSAIDSKGHVSLQSFCYALFKFFKVDPTRKIVQGQKLTFYPLQWKTVGTLETLIPGDYFDSYKLAGYLIDCRCHVIKIKENYIEASQATEWLCNGNKVIKSIHFYSDNKFEVFIRGQKINLEADFISAQYSQTHEGIRLALEQVRSISLCRGNEVKKKNIKHHGYMIQETLSNENDENLTVEVLRSKACLQNAPITGRLSNCARCQRMKIRFIDNKRKTSPTDVLDQCEYICSVYREI